MHYISIFSTVVTFIFTAAVFNRYRRRGGVHLLLWSIGLALYGLGTLTEALMLFTFRPLGLKIWYLSGAMLKAAWLGQGTLHLLARRRGLAFKFTIGLAVVSLAAILLVMFAPLTPAAAAFDVHQPVSAQYKDILPRSTFTIILTILLNIYGTITLVGGALYSAWLFWRKSVLLNRMIGNLLIAAGALMPAMGGSFLKAGLPDWLYLSEFLGVVLMYVGFIQATAVQPVRQNPPPTPEFTQK